jgi:ribosomal protein L7/L12
MKVTVSLSEAFKAVREHYGFPAECVISIADVADDTVCHRYAEYINFLREHYDHDGIIQYKIPAIKAIREKYVMGLREAKDIVDEIANKSNLT